MIKLNFIYFFLTLFFFNSQVTAQEKTQASNPTLDTLMLGVWTNDSHFIKIRDAENIFLDINRSCGVNFPIRIIDSCSFEIIWNPNIDCVFDLGILKDFNLKDFPKIGKPFAKYTLNDDLIIVEYYYPNWVEEFSKQKLSEVFTNKYSRLE